MRAKMQKTIGAIALFFTVMTAQSVFAYYNPATGRFLSRDPLGEPGFQLVQGAQGPSQLGPVPVAQQSSRWINRNPMDLAASRSLYARSLNPKQRGALYQQPSSFSDYLFVQNEPVANLDILGLCPSGTCDKWTVTIILMRSVDIGVGFLDLRAQLTADKSCCIEPHERYYRYLGAGLGVGFDWTINYKVGSATFNTACIPWKAHNGFGRVTGAGAGIGITYGITYLSMPQGYVSIASPSYGFDLSDFTTAGRWWLE